MKTYYPCTWLSFVNQKNEKGLRIRSKICILPETILNTFKCFASIAFHSKPYYGSSTIFIYFCQHPLWICYAARCVQFTVFSGRKGVLFFPRDRSTHLAAHSSKRLNPLYVIILVSLDNTLTRQDFKKICFFIDHHSEDFPLVITCSYRINSWRFVLTDLLLSF